MTTTKADAPITVDAPAIINDLSQAWLAEHGGIPARLQRTDIHEIAWRLVSARVQPTVDAVRTVNGGKGSPNVIHPALRLFFAGELHKRWKAPPPIEGIPEPLMRLWQEVHAIAAQHAEAGLVDARAELAAQRQQFAEERTALAQHAREIEERVSGLQVLIDTLKTDLAAERATLGATRDERDAARRDLAVEEERSRGLKDQTGSLKTDLAAERTTVAALRKAEGAARQQLATLQRLRDPDFWRVFARHVRVPDAAPLAVLLEREGIEPPTWPPARGSDA